MDPIALISQYYTPDSDLFHVVVNHSQLVADKALAVAKAHPELGADTQFLYEAAMLHDIGIFKTNAPDILCTGIYPYICHGYLGADIVRNAGYEKHALVCERHTGTGLSLYDIESQNLPIPHRDMVPISVEEQIICFADKFYSKSHPLREKTVEKILKSMGKYGQTHVLRFDNWCKKFL